MDYSCSEPTTARDALKVVVTEPNGTTFTGDASVTCDGTRESTQVFVYGPEYVSKAVGHAVVTLQGTTLEQDVNVVPATSDGPVFPPVKASVEVVGKIVFTSATKGTINVKYACNGYAGGISVVVTGRHGERATGGDGLSCNAQGYPNAVDTDTFPLVAEGKGFRVGRQKVTVQASLLNEEPLPASRATLVRKKAHKHC